MHGEQHHHRKSENKRLGYTFIKTLVIGGNRYFGKRLVQKLVTAGHDVTVINRGSKPEDNHPDVYNLTIDRRDFATMKSKLSHQHWDLIYDQVCFDAIEAKQATEIFQDHVDHYIFTSSQSVYGPGSHIPESSFNPHTYQIKEIVTVSQYAEAKRQAETTFFQSAEFKVSAVRFPIVMGEDDYTERFKFHVTHVKEQKPIYFPYLEGSLSCIHAQDAANLLFHLKDFSHIQEINGCAKKPLPLKAMMELISQKTGKAYLVAKNGDHSPYGIELDWFMNTQKLSEIQFEARAYSEWLPDLVSFHLF